MKRSPWSDGTTTGESSGTGNDCVEVADLTQTAYGGIAIRDSKDPDGPVLLVAPDDWASFVATVKGAEFPTL